MYDPSTSHKSYLTQVHFKLGVEYECRHTPTHTRVYLPIGIEVFFCEGKHDLKSLLEISIPQSLSSCFSLLLCTRKGRRNETTAGLQIINPTKRVSRVENEFQPPTIKTKSKRIVH